ncbi:MAG: ABC transporter permease [Planctomycetes bacterium]|nr:ABC transporter permease [Planctomycetota bacterium]
MSIIKNIKEIIYYRHVISGLVTTDLKVRYRRSFLGFLWNLINPLLNLTVMAVVFSQVLQIKMEYFAIYVFTGMLPYQFFSSSVAVGSKALVTYEQYIKKLTAPKIIFPLALVIANFVDFILAFLAFFVLVLLIHPAFGMPMLFLPVACLIMFTATLGFALICSVVHVYFRDFQNILAVILQAGFFSVPIIYTYESIPEESKLRELLYYNPMHHYLTLFRDTLFGVGDPLELKFPGTTTMLTTSIGAVLLLSIGISVFYKYQKDIIYRL